MELENFIFLPNQDQIGNCCDSDENFVAINTKKERKKNITELITINDNNYGIYIKKNYCDKILKDLTHSDNYLHIENYDEIDKFIEKIKFIGPDGPTLIFTNGNYSYIDTLIKNLLLSYEQFNKKKDRKIGVFCSDKKGYELSKKLGFDSCLVECKKMNIYNCFSNVSPEEYRRLCFVKLLLIDHILSKNFCILYIDPDMAFNSKKIKNTDFVDLILNRKFSINYNFSYDKISHINDFDIKIDNVISGSIIERDQLYLNSNLILILPTEFNKFLYKINYREFVNISKNIYGSDEVYINRIGRHQKYFSFWSEKYYPNGLNSFKFKDVAFIFHSNCISGLNNKINLLKKCDAWFLE